MSAPSDAETPCGECGMPTRRGEFHPYIACLAFKSCQSSKVVRENLDAIAEYRRAEGREAAVKIAKEGACEVKTGDEVEKVGGDYRYRGVVVAVFEKRSGAVRVVVENDGGMLFIFSPAQLRPAT